MGANNLDYGEERGDETFCDVLLSCFGDCFAMLAMTDNHSRHWIPAFAGMTESARSRRHCEEQSDAAI